VVKRMSTRDARANFSEILGLVYYTEEPVIVEKKGRPVAVIISPKEFERIQQEREECRRRGWEAVRRVQEANRDKDPDEVYRDVTAVVEQVRRERHEKERAAGGH
jgi:prevent-host-death family protein